MIKKLINKLRRNKVPHSETMIKLNEALHPTNNLNVVYEELTEYVIRDIRFKLGDRVICRSNECDPLIVGEIVEFWDNNGKWSNCIPQVKDEITGKIWGIMGIIKPYTDELVKILMPLRPLEQWNYFVDDIHKFSEEDIIRKEKRYSQIRKD